MIKAKRMAKFFKVRADIEIKKKDPKNLWAYELGKQREILTMKILEDLRESCIIHDFILPGNLSYSDVERGIDVFVVRVGERKYRVIPLSITGKAWVEKHKERHPKIPVISVDFKESYLEIKEKIVDAISQYK